MIILFKTSINFFDSYNLTLASYLISPKSIFEAFIMDFISKYMETPDKAGPAYFKNFDIVPSASSANTPFPPTAIPSASIVASEVDAITELDTTSYVPNYISYISLTDIKPSVAFSDILNEFSPTFFVIVNKSTFIGIFSIS